MLTDWLIIILSNEILGFQPVSFLNLGTMFIIAIIASFNGVLAILNIEIVKKLLTIIKQ